MNMVKFEMIMFDLTNKMIENEKIYDKVEKEIGDQTVQKLISSNCLKEALKILEIILNDKQGILTNTFFNGFDSLKTKEPIRDWGDYYYFWKNLK